MEDMRIIGVNEVAVDLEDYTTLVEDQHDFMILVSALLENARLSWDKKRLSYSDEDVSMILKMIAPYKYEHKFAELIAEQEEAQDGIDIG